MPELSDVEGFRRYLARYATGKPIDRVEVLDPAIARNRTPAALSRALDGNEFGDPRRHGKWLLVDAGAATCLMHFGMTGLLHWSAARAAPHPHDRILFHLRGGTLSYRDMRRFGGVWLARTEDEVAAVTGPLGPDALSVSLPVFDELLEGRRGALKPALMDQTLVAGLGNLLCDEILWQARLNPRERVSGLSVRQRHRLYATMRAVLREANRHARVPPLEGWLTGVRDERDARCPRCGRRLLRATIGGRTTRWCPYHQRRR
jgi:formamidopyrimidine-DNA glycosylase